jgi:hypothetical protein
MPDTVHIPCYIKSMTNVLNTDKQIAVISALQVIKVYTQDLAQHPERKYRLNGITRQHMRRLSRLTLAFSKKLENFEAAVIQDYRNEQQES